MGSMPRSCVVTSIAASVSKLQWALATRPSVTTPLRVGSKWVMEMLAITSGVGDGLAGSTSLSGRCDAQWRAVRTCRGPTTTPVPRGPTPTWPRPTTERRYVVCAPPATACAVEAASAPARGAPALSAGPQAVKASRVAKQ